jgi:hypothetical protein
MLEKQSVASCVPALAQQKLCTLKGMRACRRAGSHVGGVTGWKGLVMSLHLFDVSRSVGACWHYIIISNRFSQHCSVTITLLSYDMISKAAAGNSFYLFAVYTKPHTSVMYIYAPPPLLPRHTFKLLGTYPAWQM